MRDRFNVPDYAKIDNPPKNNDYVAIAAIFDGEARIGFAMFTVTDWATGRGRRKSSRPMAEVLLVRPGAETAVPDDGLVGEDDPAYEAIGRGELIWSGRSFRIQWWSTSRPNDVQSVFRVVIFSIRLPLRSTFFREVSKSLRNGFEQGMVDVGRLRAFRCLGLSSGLSCWSSADVRRLPGRTADQPFQYFSGRPRTWARLARNE